MQINKVIDRYTPFATVENVNELFESVKVTKWNTHRVNINSALLWVNVKDHFKNKSVYVVPTKALSDLIESRSIYGKPVYKDVYLTLENNCLCMQFQQIIGRHALVALTEAQTTELLKLFTLID